jgi:hypothetical protein
MEGGMTPDEAPRIRCGFPAPELHAVLTNGGPLPKRLERDLEAQHSGFLLVDMTPQELISLRRWWNRYAVNDTEAAKAAEACASAADSILHGARRCHYCGDDVEFDPRSPDTWPDHCLRCHSLR